MKNKKSHYKKGMRVYSDPSDRLAKNLQRQRTDLAIVIRVMEHDKSISPRFWQLISLRKLLGEIERQIAGTHQSIGRKIYGCN
jgi:hypothetical protein